MLKSNEYHIVLDNLSKSRVLLVEALGSSARAEDEELYEQLKEIIDATVPAMAVAEAQYVESGVDELNSYPGRQQERKGKKK